MIDGYAKVMIMPVCRSMALDIMPIYILASYGLGTRLINTHPSDQVQTVNDFDMFEKQTW